MLQATWIKLRRQRLLWTNSYVLQASEKDLEYLKCGICLELCTRPVSTSCQHNFCLKCFKKHVNHGKTDCPTCRTKIHKDLLQNPRVNTMLTSRLRKVHVRHPHIPSTPSRKYTSAQHRLCLPPSIPLQCLSWESLCICLTSHGRLCRLCTMIDAAIRMNLDVPRS